MHAARGVGRRHERVKCSGNVAMECRAGRGQRERAMLSYEERHAEGFLERLHLPRERRLREKKLLRGARERQMPRRSLEALEEIERGQPAQRLMHASTSCEAFRISV